MVEQVQRVAREYHVASPAAVNSQYPMLPQASRASPPKIDATDRRQIEAQNEDRSHSTKEELDDIKRTHYKEKKKKEQSNMEPGPSGINTQGWVSQTLIL